MSMGRRQRGIRVLWRICWERDRWHPIPKGAKRRANKCWRAKLKEKLLKEATPNETTREAIDEAERGEAATYNDAKTLFPYLGLDEEDAP